jgi:NAD(P)-dependent dehydrogenase (short-subunit alcohol dehydrogenase family)
VKKDRVVVITGAAGGIGSVFVDRFLANGDTVIATDATKEHLEQLVSSRNAGQRLITSPTDISSEHECLELANVAGETAGRIDVLVNCAGYFPVLPFEKMSAADWRRVIDINLTGTFLMIHAMLPLMKTSGWGRIINFSSGSVFSGVPGQTHYVAAKAGLIGLSRSLAREVGVYGITVNVVTPGLTVTKAAHDTFSPELLAAQREGRAIQRDQHAEDLVGPVFFLASPDSDFISGQILNVDGGLTTH